MIKSLIDDEINKISKIIENEIETLNQSLSLLEKSINDLKSKKTIEIHFNLDEWIFSINDNLSWEQIFLEWKDIQTIFNLWKYQYDKILERKREEKKEISENIKKLNMFISNINSELEINISFGSNKIPVLTYNFSKKYKCIEKIIFSKKENLNN